MGANQAATAVSQALAAELSGTILPAQGVSVVNSITREVYNTGSSVEASVSSAALKILAAINAQSQMTHQLSVALASVVGEDLWGPTSLPSTPEALGDTGARSHPCPRRRKKLTSQMPTACTCAFTTRHSSRQNRSSRWIISRQEEGSVHERHCPLWNMSQVTTKYGMALAVLQRLGVFGSLSIRGSPYKSNFGWEISQNLALKPIVPETSPAFKVILHYFHPLQPEIDAKGCMKDLMAVFRSGQGSPTDTLLDGTTLLNVR